MSPKFPKSHLLRLYHLMPMFLPFPQNHLNLLNPMFLMNHLLLKYHLNLRYRLFPKNLILLMFLMCHLHPMCLMSLRFLK